jgi:hypothetical protein
MINNVIEGNFYTRLDIDPDKVLDKAKGKLDKVLVIGVCTDGDDYCAASTGKKGDLLLMIELFKAKLINGDYD